MSYKITIYYAEEKVLEKHCKTKGYDGEFAEQLEQYERGLVVSGALTAALERRKLDKEVITIELEPVKDNY